MLTRSTFEMVAGALREQRALVDTRDGEQVLNRLALVFSQRFAEENPRFDRARFLKAAGVGE